MQDLDWKYNNLLNRKETEIRESVRDVLEILINKSAFGESTRYLRQSVVLGKRNSEGHEGRKYSLKILNNLGIVTVTGERRFEKKICLEDLDTAKQLLEYEGT